MGTKSRGRLRADGSRGQGPWKGITYRSPMPRVCRSCGQTRRRFLTKVDICVPCAMKYRRATRGKK